ncbi:hypothetical protein ACFX1W_024223 [Malus domestica]
MLEHTTSNSFKCLFGSSMDNPWYFGMRWSELDFNSNYSVLPCAAVGYWIHKGAALSNPEVASSLSVRLSMASSSFSSNSDSASELELGSLGYGCLFFLLKALSKSPSNSEMFALIC